MTADGPRRAPVPPANWPDDENHAVKLDEQRPTDEQRLTDEQRAQATEQALDDAERAASNEWAILVRPRHSRNGRKDYVRQIVIDVAVVVVALLIVAVLS